MPCRCVSRPALPATSAAVRQEMAAVSEAGSELYDVPLPGVPVQGAVMAQPGGMQPLAHFTHNRRLADEEGYADDYAFQESLEHFSESSNNDYPGSRKPIPVPSISRFMMPYSGLHFLSGLDRLDIQQTVELEDLLASVESENRYLVKTPESETVLVAAETSTSCHRLCLGSNRAFHLRVYDASRQETLHLTRRLACQHGLFGCYLQRMDVLASPGRFLGSVVQEWTLLVPVLRVQDAAGIVQYHIEGPRCMVPKEAVFKISSRDRLVELGSISHLWNSAQSTYILTVIFPDANLDVNQKALLLGAAFLLEYMYFETAKKRRWLPCFP